MFTANNVCEGNATNYVNTSSIVSGIFQIASGITHQMEHLIIQIKQQVTYWQSRNLYSTVDGYLQFKLFSNSHISCYGLSKSVAQFNASQFVKELK
ncbi:MAG: hypothetical protein IPH32_16895 [Bacteroidetes bacterium]|nr:hypothetical protein [Bacteroidota bacterium]